jgi:hypothetical protein
MEGELASMKVEGGSSKIDATGELREEMILWEIDLWLSDLALSGL